MVHHVKSNNVGNANSLLNDVIGKWLDLTEPSMEEFAKALDKCGYKKMARKVQGKLASFLEGTRPRVDLIWTQEYKLVRSFNYLCSFFVSFLQLAHIITRVHMCSKGLRDWACIVCSKVNSEHAF